MLERVMSAMGLLLASWLILVFLAVVWELQTIVLRRYYG